MVKIKLMQAAITWSKFEFPSLIPSLAISIKPVANFSLMDQLFSVSLKQSLYYLVLYGKMRTGTWQVA